MTSDDKNAARLAVLAAAASGELMVHEIYASIQGESTHAGLPCTFVRLTGCPLRCRWCDTPHAFAEGRAMAVPAVLRAVAALTPRLVEVTGGEPLAQPLCLELLTKLADAGYAVLLETSGALAIDAVDRRVGIIMDVKCPGSGEWASNRLENLSHLKPTGEVKFVIGNRDDFDWALALIRERRLARHAVHFSPVFGELENAELCQWIVATGLPIRFSLQLHKHIWGPLARGV